MTDLYRRGSLPASSLHRELSRAERWFLRAIFYAFTALTVWCTVREIVDRVMGENYFYYVATVFFPALGSLLFGILLWTGRKRASVATRRANEPRPAPAGTVPASELTPEQQLVRKHFPGATFLTAEEKRASAAASELRMAKYAQRPRPRFYELPVSWQTAERSAEQWMRHNGYPYARRTPRGPDGGVDVEGVGVVAQVKHQAKPVGPAVVQQLSGVTNSRHHRGSKALFFASFGYSDKARAVARDMGVELYQYDGNTWVRIT